MSQPIDNNDNPRFIPLGNRPSEGGRAGQIERTRQHWSDPTSPLNNNERPTPLLWRNGRERVFTRNSAANQRLYSDERQVISEFDAEMASIVAFVIENGIPRIIRAGETINDETVAQWIRDQVERCIGIRTHSLLNTENVLHACKARVEEMLPLFNHTNEERARMAAADIERARARDSIAHFGGHAFADYAQEVYDRPRATVSGLVGAPGAALKYTNSGIATALRTMGSALDRMLGAYKHDRPVLENPRPAQRPRINGLYPNYGELQIPPFDLGPDEDLNWLPKNIQGDYRNPIFFPP